MLEARLASSTTVSGHTDRNSSSFSTSRPRRSRSASNRSKIFGGIWTTSPSRSNRRSAVFKRNGPKSYNRVVLSLIQAPMNFTRKTYEFSMPVPETFKSLLCEYRCSNGEVHSTGKEMSEQLDLALSSSLRGGL